MAAEYKKSPSSLSVPASAPIAVQNLSKAQAKPFEDLKTLCQKNKTYWPVSELEGRPAHGANDDIDLLYFGTYKERFEDRGADLVMQAISSCEKLRCKRCLQAVFRVSRLAPQNEP